jgi:NAD(P)-dependent dehydrogenase (short-subunit alcohol dehydrogenase family)
VTNTVLVTGASRGIGAATARLAAARGYAVGVNYLRNRDAAEAVVGEIEAAGGRVKQFIPMHRGGQPEEVAQAILWLLSDEASYTTGAFIEVSGGR